LEVILLILNELFKGYLQGSNLKCLLGFELWRFLLALSGPDDIICPIENSVKDRVVHNCA
jgi:hypothetical protein